MGYQRNTVTGKVDGKGTSDFLRQNQYANNFISMKLGDKVATEDKTAVL